MKLTGIHLLMTYQCTRECDHCFVFGSPRQSGTMTTGFIRDLLGQARELGTVEWIYFEGGEPFLYYAALLEGARLAAEAGFQVGLVTNAYWATDEEDALRCMRPFRGLVRDLSISTDLYHGEEMLNRSALTALEAARQLEIPADTISIAQPDEQDARPSQGQVPLGTSAVMYKGRAAETLAERAPQKPWSGFTRCPHEELREPRRVHVDAAGHLQVCQGISIGNLNQAPLGRICESYDPDTHPIIGPLLRGGPIELVTEHGLSHDERYADACHLCYEARCALRPRYPGILAPDQSYGVPSDA